MVSAAEVHAAQAAKMSEKALDLKVRGLLNALGLAPFSFHPADGVGGMRAGYPDWTILGSRILFRELKSEKGKLSPAQQAVTEHLTAIGADVAVWRPTDLFSARIAEELRAVADPATRQRAAVVTQIDARRREAEKAKKARQGGSPVRRRRAA